MNIAKLFFYRTPPVAASANILFYIIFQKDVAEYIAVLHCIIVSFWNLKSFSFAFILCITRCHSLYNSLSLVLTCCHSLSFIVIRSHSLSLVVPHHSSFCSACFFWYVLFYKNLIVLHHGDNTFLFYFNICIKFTLSTAILTMKKWWHITWYMNMIKIL